MRITAYLYTTPPNRYLGADLMMGHLLRVLREAGHQIQIMTEVDHGFYTWDGMCVVPKQYTLPHPCDVFISIPELGRKARSYIKDAPYVSVAHNTQTSAMRGLDHLAPDLMIANSDQMARVLMDHHPMIVHPPLDYSRLQSTVEDRRYVTLVNLSEDKGVGVFYEMARRCPEMPFLGVLGGYGTQVRLPAPNVTLTPQTRAMGDVYGKTRVLLFPSKHESYGMVAAEATVMGIPVMASRLPGVEEALGSAGRWIDARDPDAIEAELRSLMEDDAYYAAAVDAAKHRATELDERSTESLARWVRVVESLTAS